LQAGIGCPGRPAIFIRARNSFFFENWGNTAMPVYEYFCENCAELFSSLQPMARCSEPLPCPQCANASPRMISAPRLNAMRSDVRMAHQINENSAHQPKMMQKHQCGAGCSHNQDATPALKQARNNQRPWMIGH